MARPGAPDPPHRCTQPHLLLLSRAEQALLVEACQRAALASGGHERHALLSLAGRVRATTGAIALVPRAD